ncbi:ABC transporter ATP-binding protein [bacterium]|nr:MAG: ABC transporter ATP-binding protein [bacterium]
MEKFLRVCCLKRSFRQGDTCVDVLNGIDLELQKGELLSVVGPSGAGKSTFLHILGTLDRPTSGKVLFDGEDVFERRDQDLADFRNRKIGFVFQFHHLLPEFTALENASMPARIAGMEQGEAEASAKELLDGVGLGHRLRHRPSELSGGEQQRVSLARALVMKPSLLLADEPTGNLDHATGKVVQDLLLYMNRCYGVTLVVATHNLELAAETDRVLTIEDGRVVKEVIN